MADNLISQEDFDRIFLASQPERWLEERVRVRCKELALPRYHTLRSKGSEFGFPDDLIIVNNTLLVWELKKKGEKPTAKQQQWLEAFRRVQRIEVAVCYPSDWPTMSTRLEL
jgi:hypothetical protein